jgi:hypothetical protein
LPGTGKTTLANELTPWVCEADLFFYRSGKYEFNPEQIGEAHKYCQDLAWAYMQHHHSRIAVSNTFSRRWEFKPYIELAQKNGYDVIEITLTGDSFGSIHNVPDETIQQMKARWER